MNVYKSILNLLPKKLIRLIKANLSFNSDTLAETIAEEKRQEKLSKALSDANDET